MSPTVLEVSSQAWGGGMERLIASLAREAPARGWRCVVAYWDGEPPPEPACEHIRLPGAGVPPRWPWALARLVRRLRPDVVHLHDVQAGSLGAFAVRSSGFSRVAYTEHSMIGARPWKYRAARRLAARLPAANLALSDVVARSMARGSRVPLDRIAVVRPGVPQAEPPSAPLADEPRFLSVANLWPWKGHAVLLRAIAAMLPSRATVVLAGDGVERASLEREVSGLGIGNAVTFAGFVEEPWALAEGAWAYVHPSLSEGVPLAVMEAMMRGLPVIASRVGGIPEIVEEGTTGLLVAPGDVQALARAMSHLVRDRALRERLGAAARDHAVAHLGERDFLDAHFALYERLARGGR